MQIDVHHHFHFPNPHQSALVAIVDALNNIGDQIMGGKENITTAIDRLHAAVALEIKQVADAIAAGAGADADFQAAADKLNSLADMLDADDPPPPPPSA